MLLERKKLATGNDVFTPQGIFHKECRERVHWPKAWGDFIYETAQVVNGKFGLGEILPCPAKLRKTKWMQMDVMLPTVMFLV